MRYTSRTHNRGLLRFMSHFANARNSGSTERQYRMQQQARRKYRRK